ncbi:hypothetical protein Bca4012_004058 [Brassica carinata]
MVKTPQPFRFQTNRLCYPSGVRPRVRARAPAGGLFLPFLIFSFCSPSLLPLPFRYVRSSRSELASPVEAPVARSLHLVEGWARWGGSESDFRVYRAALFFLFGTLLISAVVGR